MYPRRLSRTIVSPQTNLKKIFLNHTNKVYFYMIRQSLFDLRNAKEVSSRIQVLIKNMKLYNFFRTATPKTLKDQSANLLKMWAHQCECVVAQRLRRSQQMFCMYSRLWEEKALKELLRNMRLAFAKKSKELVLSAIGVSTYNWNENRISDDEMKKYIGDIDYIYTLKDKTICLACDTTSRTKTSSICECGTPGQVDPSKSYDNWVPFLEKQDLVVWRKLRESGSYEYKVFGSYADVTAADFLNVQVDNEYRKKWDTTAVVLEVAESDEMTESNSDIIYWEMLWPRLFANRDYVFNRRYYIDNESNTLIVYSKSTVHSKYPTRTDTYRVEDYWSRMIIKPYTDIDKPGVEFSLTYYDNPGVNIPSSVTNWVAMRAMPDFLERLRQASIGYKEYCLKEGVSEMCKMVKEQVMEDDEFLDFCSCNHEPIILRPKVPEKKDRGSKGKNIEKPAKNIEVVTPISEPSPPPTNNAMKTDNSYWKYLHPTYYFS